MPINVSNSSSNTFNKVVNLSLVSSLSTLSFSSFNLFIVNCKLEIGLSKSLQYLMAFIPPLYL